uniref:GATOR complex protein NPRL3 n=1 Tax=Romanomermis culicivorax TaxID=13658 RepID=A0A915KGT7_ROMCU
MGFLFAVRQEVCSQPLEVKINDVRFVCYPMHLNNNISGVLSNTHNHGNIFSPTNDEDCKTTPKGMHRTSASLPQLILSSNNGHRDDNKCRCYAGNALPPTVKAESRRKKSKTMNEDKILLFNIVFGLYGNARRSVVQSYQDLSKRIAIALKHEENRCQYLTSESKTMMDCIEDMQSPP